MTEVKFEFDIDQRVRTPLGEVGIVEMLALCDTKVKKIFVNLRGGDGSWYREDQIEAL